jgi:hypothetical protein
MARGRRAKPEQPKPDQKPKFRRGDVVKLIGINGPEMLVSGVGARPEEPDDDDYEEEETEQQQDASKAEYLVSVIYFNQRGELQGDYDGTQIREGLLQIVKTAVKVREEAEAAEREATGHY